MLSRTRIKTYLIEKGKHYAQGWKFYPFITKKNFRVAIYLNDSCKYLGSTQLEEQINKIYGIGNMNHHRASDRLGFRYDVKKDMFEIFDYFYLKESSKPYTRSKGFIKANEWVEYKVITKRYWFGRTLNSYYGGALPSPHDMIIRVKVLE